MGSRKRPSPDVCADTLCGADHERLRPQLNELRKDVGNLSGSYNDLESRVESLLSQYDEYVS